MSIGGGIWYVGAFLVALGILVVFHELGHYAAARYCGVKVLRFSVGFGKVIFLRRRGADQTEWTISAIPLGGYVKMLDEREGDVPPEELARAFNRQPVGRRALIVAAGPVANLVLAVVIYWFMFMAGVQEIRPLLNQPESGTPAAIAGLAARDLVTEVNGEPVDTWGEVRLALLDAAFEKKPAEIIVTDDRGGSRHLTLSLGELSTEDIEGDLLQKLGMRLYRHSLPAVIDRVLPGSPAEQSGLLPHDQIVAINGVEIPDWSAMQDAIVRSPGVALDMEILRDGQSRQIKVTPNAETVGGRLVGRIGVAPGAVPSVYSVFTTVRLGPLDAAVRSVTTTWSTVHLSVVMMGRMVTGQLSLKNISGPVTIADFAGQSAKMGLSPYLRFLALISISLAVLNLLPIPVLDGGHLMYYLAEIIKGKPVSERALEIGQRVGIAFFVVLTIFALFNDFNRLLSG